VGLSSTVEGMFFITKRNKRRSGKAHGNGKQKNKLGNASMLHKVNSWERSGKKGGGGDEKVLVPSGRPPV